MKVCLAATGTRGDVQPLLALARELGARGHAAYVCAPPDFTGLAADLGVAFRPFGPPFRETIARIQKDVERDPLRLARGGEIAVVALPQIEELPPLCGGADILVGTITLPLGASIAQYHGIPYFKAIFQPNLLASDAYPPFLARRQDWPRWVNRSLWSVTQRIMNQVMGPLVNDGRKRLGLAPLRDFVRHVHETSNFLLAVDPELTGELPHWPFPHRTTGFWHLGDPADALPSEVMTFLAEGPPPVYIGFGSMTAPDARSRTRVLLDAALQAGVRAILSAGWADLGRDFALPASCLAVGAVSHAALFGRCAAIVHHGGSGTTATAARAGVPQVVVPHVMDQYFWAWRVERARIGPPAIPIRRLTASGLAKAMRATASPEFITRARDVGHLLAARDGLGEAVAILEERMGVRAVPRVLP